MWFWIQGYSALKDFFPTMEMRPNPQCSNTACLECQVSKSATTSETSTWIYFCVQRIGREATWRFVRIALLCWLGFV